MGDYLDLTAALLPCLWGYAEVGLRLAAGAPPPEPRYRAWIAMYASPEFQELASWCRDLLDQLAARASPQAREAAETAFLASSWYELAFWQMAWDRQTWYV